MFEKYSFHNKVMVKVFGPISQGVLLSIFLTASTSWGFSLGQMDVRSSYGEKFNGEIELTTRKSGDVKVKVGSPKDYQMLGIKRPTVVDELYSLPLEADNTIRIQSDRPLFYPSFNLIVRVEQGGDKLVENYLITVDFQQSVTLKIRAHKEDMKAMVPEPEEEVAEEETVPDKIFAKADDKAGETEEEIAGTSMPDKVIPEPAQLPAGSSVVTAVHPAPLVVRELPVREEVVAHPRPVPPLDEEPVSVIAAAVTKQPESQAAPAVTEPAQVVAQAPEIKPEPAPEPEPQKMAEAASVPEVPAKVSLAPRAASSGHMLGPLKKGESLSDMVRELTYDSKDAQRVAVALWMDNQDKFIKGNIHGLKEGVELSLGQLDQRLNEIGGRQARWTMQSQWQEWQVIKSRIQLASQLELPPMVKQILIPPDRLELESRLRRLLGTWEQSWEEGNLDEHMALFAKAETPGTRGYSYWKRFKSLMFQRHRQVSLRISRPVLIRIGDRIFAAFDQWFDSNRMSSYGRKTIEWGIEGTEWKIFGEKFAVKKYWDKSRALGTATQAALTEEDFLAPAAMSYPLVIHTSSHMEPDGASQAVNELREEGYHAYSSPLYIGKKRKIYRVLVGRFSNWDTAEQLTLRIRKISGARFAAPKRFPFTLLAAEALDARDASAKSEELVNKGLSPLFFDASAGNFPNPSIKILLGGFLEKDNAQRMVRELSKEGMKLQVIAP